MNPRQRSSSDRPPLYTRCRGRNSDRPPRPSPPEQSNTHHRRSSRRVSPASSKQRLYFDRPSPFSGRRGRNSYQPPSYEQLDVHRRRSPSPHRLRRSLSPHRLRRSLSPRPSSPHQLWTFRPQIQGRAALTERRMPRPRPSPLENDLWPTRDEGPLRTTGVLHNSGLASTHAKSRRDLAINLVLSFFPPLTMQSIFCSPDIRFAGPLPLAMSRNIEQNGQWKVPAGTELRLRYWHLLEPTVTRDGLLRHCLFKGLPYRIYLPVASSLCQPSFVMMPYPLIKRTSFSSIVGRPSL
jgi:hypothetical protein